MQNSLMIPLDPEWISWNKVRPRLTRAISPKTWSLGGRFTVCQSWCCGFVTDPRPLVAATKKRPEIPLKSVKLHHGNARPHISFQTSETIGQMGWSQVPQLPYIPDLAPCDFYLFFK
ncbi:hypothetical protein LAZ67_10001760 [Cordylochernes scorpioides]|uniref:Histone-lysine N-methyltransferase SETMAR n=1 Tax=Cordylochernes scorpioides TaxID=51811 RepID=A0ABY6L109_9ARAC|nr:hypothetical protein LAZ67_10001760 [Cordylochernes scorpioides]